MVVKLENSGYTITLAQPAGSGGMGETYLHATNDGMLAKVMFDEFPEAKVRYLMARPLVPSGNGHAFAWPVDIGTDVDTGEAKLYLMPKAKNAVDLPAVIGAADWLPESFKYRVMHNQVRALQDLNQANYFRGDMPNSMVNADGFVTEIDLDSLQVSHRDMQYLCGVGKPDWLAPELIDPLMAGELGDIPTTAEHDAWSIAVSLWMLLRADHPFDCRYTGAGKRPTRLERTKRGYWAYSARHPDFQPRRGTPPLAQLAPEIAYLFRQTFETGHGTPAARPNLTAWEAALLRLDGDEEVTLSDYQWRCVEIGEQPHRFVRRTQKKSIVHYSVVAAASLAVLGGAGLMWNRIQPNSILNRVPEPEITLSSPPVQPNAKKTKITANTPVAEPEIAGREQVPEIAIVAPPIDLHSVKRTGQGEIPVLWKHVKEHLK